MGDSTLEKSALIPQDAPRKITIPKRKKAFTVPKLLNLVKKVGDLKLLIGNKIRIRYSGTMFFV